MPKPRLIFFGSPKFAVPVLAQARSWGEVAAVVTEPDRPAGRGQELTATPVRVAAEKWRLPVLQPATKRELADQLSRLDADIGILVAYGLIIPAAVINAFPFGIVNIHGSLLPRWRGAAPIQHAILAGDKVSGASIMLLDKGVDSGPLLAKIKVPIAADDTTSTLTDKIIAAGVQQLAITLPAYLAGKIKPQAQRGRPTIAPKFTKEDGLLDWRRPAAMLERQIRACHPWPGSYTFWRGQRLLIHEGRAAGGRLIPVTVQLAGRRKMAWPDFLRGQHQTEAEVLAKWRAA